MNIAELKKGGFLKQLQKDYFAVRLRVAGGNLTLRQLETVKQVAKRYGKGYIHLTTRQGIEIPFIHFEQIEAVRGELLAGGIGLGVCGGTVRGVMACQGSFMCPHGHVDAKELSQRIDEQFFAAQVPGKFKISVAGCSRSCAKPQENDLGFGGVTRPEFRENDCISCGVCADICPAAVILLQDKYPLLNREKCVNCGECVTACPSGAWRRGEAGVRVWAGGRIGRDPRLGEVVIAFLPPAKIPLAIETSLCFFREHGKSKERFGKVIERIGLENFREVMERATK